MRVAEHLMSSIGRAIARLHDTGIIHGDLTTSNMMTRLTPISSEPYEIVRFHLHLDPQPPYSQDDTLW